MKIFQKAALAAALTAGLALTGCSDSDDDPVTGGSGGYNVSGAAVKGVLKNAKVTAYELKENGERKAGTLGTARTNDKGEYTLTLTSAYTDGVLDIEVKADTQTKMVCDAEACEIGSEINVEGLLLNSLVTKEKGQDAKDVPVTAWTSMAANLAKETAKKTGGNIKTARFNASSAVTELAGFDVANTPARAITDLANATPAEQQAAIMNAVVAEMMDGGFDATALEDFSNAMKEDGAFRNSNSTSNDVGINLNTLAKKTAGVVTKNKEKLGDAAKDKLAEQQATLNEVKDQGVEVKKPMDKTLNYTRTKPPQEKPRATLTKDNKSELIKAVKDNFNEIANNGGVSDLIDDALFSAIELPMLHYLLNNAQNAAITSETKDIFKGDGEYGFKDSDFNSLKSNGSCKSGSVNLSNPKVEGLSFSATNNLNSCKIAFKNYNEDMPVTYTGDLVYILDEGNKEMVASSGKLESIFDHNKLIINNLNQYAHFNGPDNHIDEYIQTKVDYIKAKGDGYVLEAHNFELHQDWGKTVNGVDVTVRNYSGEFVLADFDSNASVKIKMTRNDKQYPVVVVSAGDKSITLTGKEFDSLEGAEVSDKNL